MIFRKFSRFLKNDDQVKILKKLNDFVFDMNTGLSKLRLLENFESFKSTVTIGVGLELEIRHNLRVIPSQRLIVRESGDGKIVDGDTMWNSNSIYLKNIGLNAVTLTVIIIK